MWRLLVALLARNLVYWLILERRRRRCWRRWWLLVALVAHDLVHWLIMKRRRRRCRRRRRLRVGVLPRNLVSTLLGREILLLSLLNSILARGLVYALGLEIARVFLQRRRLLLLLGRLRLMGLARNLKHALRLVVVVSAGAARGLARGLSRLPLPIRLGRLEVFLVWLLYRRSRLRQLFGNRKRRRRRRRRSGRGGLRSC